jgi:hypothetical protein
VADTVAFRGGEQALDKKLLSLYGGLEETTNL